MKPRHAAQPMRLARLSRAGAGLAMVAGLLVMLGWALDLEILKTWLPGRATMKPLTAASMVLLGTALWLLSKRTDDGQAKKFPWITVTVAVAAAAPGAASLFEYACGCAIGIDLMLWPTAVLAEGGAFPGRMAHATALGAVVTGTALALSASPIRRARKVAEALSLTAILIGVVGLAGYLYDVSALYGFTGYSSMSLPTAVLLTLMGFGTLALHPRGVLLGPILDARSGGVMARRLLPTIAVLPFLIGWLRLQGELAGLYSTAFGIALFASANVLIFAALVWWSARTLNRLDLLREASQTAARTALGDSERRYRRLAESLPSLAWTAGCDGGFTYFSPQWVDYTGVAAETQLESRYSSSLHPDDVEHIDRQWRQSLKTGERLDVEFRLRRYDGVYRWFRAVAIPVRDDAGAILDWFGTTTDIDDRKRAEAELREFAGEMERRVVERTRELQVAKEQAESADRLKTDFIMTMSHELRTPLNAIIGFTGTLLARLPGPLTPDQDEQLRLVQAGGRQLLMIISDVLDVARIEAGAFAVASEPVDLGMLLHQVAGQLAPLAADKALRLSVEVEPQTLVITGDRRAVIQILMNLGGNAIKFTERGSVTLSAAVNAGRVEIAVADTGIGIASHDHDKLFVKFGRIENATGSFAGGTGLGLYLCRLLSDRVGGQIDFVSEPGHGSRFVVSFPASLLRPDGESRTE